MYAIRSYYVEQEVELAGVDRGDAQAVTDGGIRSGTTPLAEDILGAREADDVVNGEEVGGVVQLVDQRQLVLDRGAHRGRRADREATLHAFLRSYNFV